MTITRLNIQQSTYLWICVQNIFVLCIFSGPSIFAFPVLDKNSFHLFCKTALFCLCFCLFQFFQYFVFSALLHLKPKTCLCFLEIKGGCGEALFVRVAGLVFNCTLSFASSYVYHVHLHVLPLGPLLPFPVKLRQGARLPTALLACVNAPCPPFTSNAGLTFCASMPFDTGRGCRAGGWMAAFAGPTASTSLH